MNRSMWGVLLILPLISACLIVEAPEPVDVPSAPLGMPGSGEEDALAENQGQLSAVLWVQTSVEAGAVCRTVFSRAQSTLDEALADPHWTAALEQQGLAQLPEKPAVIVDLDETILDNSPYQAQCLLEGKGFDEASWKEWVLRGEADAVPGALEFLDAAEKLDVTVFFISNRDAETPGDRNSPQERATRTNLEKLGVRLPLEEDTVLLKNEMPGWRSDKGSRREFVARSHRVLLLIGDDFGDFVSDVRKDVETRLEKAAAFRMMWRRCWFMLPNPMYGSWEGALFGYDSGLTPAEVLKRKKSRLRGIGRR